MPEDRRRHHLHQSKGTMFLKVKNEMMLQTPSETASSSGVLPFCKKPGRMRSAKKQEEQHTMRHSGQRRSIAGLQSWSTLISIRRLTVRNNCSCYGIEHRLRMDIMMVRNFRRLRFWYGRHLRIWVRKKSGSRFRTLEGGWKIWSGRSEFDVFILWNTWVDL